MKIDFCCSLCLEESKDEEHSFRVKGHLKAKRYYRDLKNHTREWIFIKYMRLHY